MGCGLYTMDFDRWLFNGLTSVGLRTHASVVFGSARWEDKPQNSLANVRSGMDGSSNQAGKTMDLQKFSGRARLALEVWYVLAGRLDGRLRI